MTKKNIQILKEMILQNDPETILDSFFWFEMESAINKKFPLAHKYIQEHADITRTLRLVVMDLEKCLE